jgi:hypothetical protein
LTKAQLIAEQYIMDEPGQSKEHKHNIRHSLCMESSQLKIFILSLDYSQSFNFSVLPAISLDSGILHCEIVKGSFHSDSFAQFIHNLLENMQPFPGPNSVIVMDDC